MSKRFVTRLAPVVAAALVFAACGSDDEPGLVAGDGPVEPATSEATDDEASSEMVEPRPIDVVADGPSFGTAAAAESAGVETGSGVATSDMMVAPWVAEYRVDAAMPDLPTDDSGYLFAAAAEVSASQVAELAAALGVDGEPERVDDGFGAAWRVGPDDGTAPSIWVDGDGMLSWSYNAPWSEGALVACSVSVDAEGNETSDCPEPEPPTGVPTADEAEQLAVDLLTALDVDPATLAFDTFADEWFAGVQASDRIDPRAAVRTWSFGFGADALLQYASGSLGTPQPTGPFPLVDVDTAVARLTDGVFGGFGGAATPDLAVVSGPAPEAGDGVESLPVDEPIEPVTVMLVDVQADLWWAWDADGSAWLVPAYRFIDADGGWHVTPAVSDEFLIRAEPGDPGVPIPVEGDGGIGDGAEPLPVPDPAPVDPGEPAEPEPAPVEPGTDPEGALPVLEELVGLSVEEFTAEAEAIGFTVRAVMIDGEPLAGTDDYRTDRVNVVIEGPRVVAIDSIG